MRAAYALTLLSIGCVTPPQTRAEFVTAVKKGAFGVDSETYVVERELASVVAMLEARSKECLAQRVDRSGMVGGTMEVSSTEFHPSVRLLGVDRAEFTLQVEHRPSGTGKIPPGGLFLMAEDLTRDAARTKVEFHFPTIGYGDIVEAVREWTKGNAAECPDLS